MIDYSWSCNDWLIDKKKKNMIVMIQQLPSKFSLFSSLSRTFIFSKVQKWHFSTNWLGIFFLSFCYFVSRVGLSLSCTYSYGSVRKRARSARFGVYGVEVFYRQLFRQKWIIPGQLLRNRSISYWKPTSTTVLGLCRLMFYNLSNFEPGFSWSEYPPASATVTLKFVSIVVA